MTPKIYKAKQIQAHCSDGKPRQRKPETKEYMLTVGEHLILKFHTRKTVLSNTFIYNTH